MTAIISDCRKYRYRLDRQVSDTGRTVVFIGVNPSTADATQDDATIRKMRGFCERWGDVRRFAVINLCAFRATDVKALSVALDPVGLQNNHHTKVAMFDADLIVPCWGALGKMPADVRELAHAMAKYLANSTKPVYTLGKTKCGQPKHPLMLGYDTQLENFF